MSVYFSGRFSCPYCNEDHELDEDDNKWLSILYAGFDAVKETCVACGKKFIVRCYEVELDLIAEKKEGE